MARYAPAQFTVAFPMEDNQRRRVQAPLLEGKVWIQNTDYYGAKSTLAMGQSDYRAMIEQAVQTMRTSDLEKVVLSRMVQAETADHQAGNALFEALCERYPSACVFQFIAPDGAEWWGATPERLLVKRQNQWSTIALAGTRTKANPTPWTAKEEHEEEVVKEYIINTLVEFGAQDITVSDRYERHAGHLIHLAHDIGFSSDASVDFWCEKLHPTPAVCGLPKALAMDYIRQHEPHDRGYYTGLLGMEHANGDADVYVLLRCARRTEKGFDVFAGGGITAGSNWSDEFAETQAKAAVFMDVVLRS